MKRPDLICVGATKAGTSWLFQNLSRRSDVWTSPLKEVNMLTSMFDPEASTWTARYISRQVDRLNKRGGAITMGVDEVDYSRYISDLLKHDRSDPSWYDLVYRFAKPEQICIDISPSYAALPRSAAKHAASISPDAKFVYIVRDPLERAESHLRMLVSRRSVRPKSIEEWNEFASNRSLIQAGEYSRNLTNWRTVLGDRLVVLPFGLIKKDPLNFLKAIEIFAGFSGKKYPSAFNKIHETEKISIPQEISVFLEAVVKEEYAFLEREFPSDFIDAI